VKTHVEGKRYHDVGKPNGPSKNAPEVDQFMLAEYNALRDELLKRAEFQQQILSLTLVIFGTILTFGLQVHSASIILLYPLLSLFLAASWRHDGLTEKGFSPPQAAGIDPWR
jgi:hypothetical protein